MLLKNKKTGEIVEVESCNDVSGCISIYYEEKDGQNGTKDCYSSLAELNAEWEDVPEESKEHWCINEFGTPQMAGRFNRENIYDKSRKLIGNDFETKEEAEKAVEKLKAWKRLKDKGFRFDGWKCTGSISFTFDNYYGDGQPRSASDDLDLLFGGEE